MHEMISLLEYESETGTFRWRMNRSRGALKGSIAGTAQANGYLKIKSMGKNFLVHRLIWFIEKGAPLPSEIDHINGDRTDNRIGNLRAATRQENLRNMAWVKGCGSLKGASWRKDLKKWGSSIRFGGRKIYLGVFLTELEAHAAYCGFAQQHFGEFANFGEGSPFNTGGGL